MLQERIQAKSIPVPFSGCWLWTGNLNAKGYGRLCLDNKNKYAHRVAYEAFRGPIPDNLVIDHLCRVHCCVNPAHMEVVTRGENATRGPNYYKGWKRNRAHCAYGHEYTAETTYRRLDTGDRVCRVCTKMNAHKYYLARRARGYYEKRGAK